jgi:predicted porin
LSATKKGFCVYLGHEIVGSTRLMRVHCDRAVQEDGKDSTKTIRVKYEQKASSSCFGLGLCRPSSAGNGTNIADVASRLGVRGKEDLGGGLSAIFAYEFGVDTDAVNTGATNMSTRHAYAGLKGGFGTLVIGSQDGGNDSQAPLYNQASAYALNVNNNGGQLTVVNGGDAVISRQQRVGNSIGYATTVAGVKISARHALTGTDAASGSTASQENKQRQTSIAADYTLGNLTFGGGYERRDGDNLYENTQNALATTGDVKSQWQLGAKYQFSFMTVAGLVAQQKYFGQRDSDTQYSISGLVPINASMGVQAFYAMSENGHFTGTTQGAKDTTAETDNKQFQVSAYYDLSKRTRSYVGFNRTTVESNGAGTTITKTRDDSIVLGLRHNF